MRIDMFNPRTGELEVNGKIVKRYPKGQKPGWVIAYEELLKTDSEKPENESIKSNR